MSQSHLRFFLAAMGALMFTCAFASAKPGAGKVWTTVPKMPLSAVDIETMSLQCRWAGPGGDSLGIGHGAIWLTDYHGGTLSRIPLKDALAHCNPLP